MWSFRQVGWSGRIVLALLVGGAVFGIASVVQADIPDSGVIHGCYGKPGTPQKGQLRVVDASQGEQCRFNENALDWNQAGATGATGATGPTGPTGGINAIERQGIVSAAGALVASSGFTVTHTQGSVVYDITFPAGTWLPDATNFPVMSGNVFNVVTGYNPALNIAQATLFGDGSLVYTVIPGGAIEQKFEFTVLQHVRPNNPGTLLPRNGKITIRP